MPLIATIAGRPARATPDGPRRATCSECGGEMIANTGLIKIHHWAHKHLTENCLGSRESMWHLEWKNSCLDTDRIEFRQPPRRADVLHRAGWAIEFQRSSITAQEITERERDWNEQVIWVFDVQEQFDLHRLDWHQPYRPARGPWSFSWSNQKESIVRFAGATTFLDPGKGRHLWFIREWRDPGHASGGYAWPIPKTTFIESVVNGGQPPTWPEYNTFPDTDEWKGGGSILEQASRREASTQCSWRSCDRTDTRPYMVGFRCSLHTPAALAGRQESA